MISLGTVATRVDGRLKPTAETQRLLDGADEALAAGDVRLFIRTVTDSASERSVYSEWSRRGVINGVMLLDAAGRDPRVTLLRRLKLPVVAYAEAGQIPTCPAVTYDDAYAADLLLTRLAGAGHRSVLYLGGAQPPEMFERRRRSLADAGAAHGVAVQTHHPDGDAAVGAILSRASLAKTKVTAVLAGDDELVASSATHLAAAGLAVPLDVSLIAWADSPYCSSREHPITALNSEARTTGALMAETLVRMLEGGEELVVAAPNPVIIERGSIAVPQKD